MHVIVVGCGRVGSELAFGLERGGHTVAVIDKSVKSFRKLAGFSGQKLVGLGFDRETLLAAGVERAKAFASVTSGDNSNVLSARIAKETFEIPSVVARIYDPRRAQIYQRLGIATVATVNWTTDQIRRRLLPDITANWTDGSGQVSLVERMLPDAWAGRKLANLADGDRFRVVALSRGGSTQLANPALIGQEGDVLHLLVTAEASSDLATLFATGPGGH